MDELELLKKDWKTRDHNFPRLSYEQIYKMHFKKSSSLVKWIFLISVAEFVFWVGLDIFLSSKDSGNTIENMGLDIFYQVANVINYGVLIFFVVLFYLNFQKIKTTDTAKGLMKNIIKTRRIVKYYVWFNIGFFALGLTVTFAVVLIQDHTIGRLVEAHQTLKIVAVIGIFMLVLGVMLIILWLFYRLLYGILTRRLLKNYNELEKLEM